MLNTHAGKVVYAAKGMKPILVAALAALLIRTGPAHAQRGSQGYVPQLNQGREALAQGKYLSAVSHFQEALVWESRGLGACIGLAHAYLRLGDTRRARDNFNKVLQIKPHCCEAERGLRALRSSAESDAVLATLESEVRAGSADASSRTAYAEELLERHRSAEARAEAKRALELDGEQAHACVVLGRAALLARQNEEASRWLQQAARLDPSDNYAGESLGDLAMSRSDCMAAIKFYRRCIGTDPECGEYYDRLAAACEAAGDMRGADRARASSRRLSALVN